MLKIQFNVFVVQKNSIYLKIEMFCNIKCLPCHFDPFFSE